MSHHMCHALSRSPSHHYIRCLWPVVGSETVTRIRSTAASSRHIQNTDTGHSRCQCSGQFIFAAIFSASLSFPFPIQLLNWVRTNVAHLRLGINKQSVWREQESRIHFATQKKFNVNKQCITALSTLQSPSPAHHTPIPRKRAKGEDLMTQL